MYKCRIILGVLLLLGTVYLSGCRNSQTAKINTDHTCIYPDSLKLSEQFKSDSLGLDGFRRRNCIYDSIHKTELVIGRNLIGATREEIIGWLGKPNSSGLGKEDHALIMEFVIGKDSKNNPTSLLIYYTKEGLVDNEIFAPSMARIRIELSHYDTVKMFKLYLRKFRMLSLPFKANTGCYNPDTNTSVRLDPENDSIFNKNAGHGIAIGMLRDTNNFYSLIYCAAATCWLPILSVYSKSGALINEEQISNGCGADCGYTCLDTLVVNSITDIKLTLVQESYDCDSLGKETPGTWEKTIDIDRFSIDRNGKIDKTSTHSSQKRK